MRNCTHTAPPQATRLQRFSSHRGPWLQAWRQLTRLAAKPPAAPPRGAAVLLTCAVTLGLGGCAAQWRASESPGGLPHLAFQNKALTPEQGGRQAVEADLQVGDILLSASSGLNSTGIQISTLAPVSHAALYVGDGRVIDAVGSGVRELSLTEFVSESSAVVAFRHPQITAEHQPAMLAFLRQQLGQPYNHTGIALQAPFTLQRRVCELPVLPGPLRDICLRGIAMVQLGLGPNDRFFCSQLVLEAYKRVGLPLTDADPRLASPADLLHMREGDVPSVQTHQALLYVGHFKLPPTAPALASAN